jgi:hypothetical protein
MASTEEEAVTVCLRVGDIDGAARAVMTFRNCSFDEARKIIHERLKSGKK